ncbi:MAG: hypothetical protein AB1515_10625 [Nitrospirota bacterium]
MNASMHEDARQREEARLWGLRLLIDSACYRLRADVASPHDAIDLIVATKTKALKLFPDKEPQFDLIYLPRLLRLVRERWGNPLPAAEASKPATLLLRHGK